MINFNIFNAQCKLSCKELNINRVIRLRAQAPEFDRWVFSHGSTTY